MQRDLLIITTIALAIVTARMWHEARPASIRGWIDRPRPRSRESLRRK